ncbi:MAG: hypothetical protein GY926_17410 [bacterium]|nr:hypothetical protein [bacterium]
MKKLLLLIATLVLLATACGGGDDNAAALPANDGAEPAIDTTCLADEPECDDIPGGEPQDLPAPGDVEPMVAVPVADAVDMVGNVSVTGFMVDVDGVIRLCEALAESFPPQCGGASITITSSEQIDPDDLQNEGSLTWTDKGVTVFGEMVDGTLVVTPIE